MKAAFLSTILCVYALLCQAQYTLNVYRAGDYIVINGPQGYVPYPANTIQFRVYPPPADNRIFIEYARGVAIANCTPPQFLKKDGSVWGVTAAQALDNFLASVPLQFASFGTTPPTNTTVTTTQTISTTNTLKILVVNKGTVPGTLTYGGLTYTLGVEEGLEFKAEYDYTTNKYTPLAALVVQSTATAIFYVTRTTTQ